VGRIDFPDAGFQAKPQWKSYSGNETMSRPMQIHYFPTPNGRKVSIALEEMGLAYEIAGEYPAGRAAAA